MRYGKMITVILCLVLLTGIATAEYVPLTVNLTILERLVIGGLLPKETSFANWKIFNDLRIALAPTDAELKAINPQSSPEGGTLADWGAVPEKEITFGEVAENMIVEALKRLDSESKLLPEHISIYEKFVLREK